MLRESWQVTEKRGRGAAGGGCRSILVGRGSEFGGVVELGCPGTRYGKAYLAFEVYESRAYDDTDKEEEVGVWV